MCVQITRYRPRIAPTPGIAFFLIYISFYSLCSKYSPILLPERKKPASLTSPVEMVHRNVEALNVSHFVSILLTSGISRVNHESKCNDKDLLSLRKMLGEISVILFHTEPHIGKVCFVVDMGLF